MKKILGIVLIIGGLISFVFTIIDGYKNGFGRIAFGRGISGSLCITALGIFIYIDAF